MVGFEEKLAKPANEWDYFNYSSWQWYTYQRAGIKTPKPLIIVAGRHC